MLYSVWLLCVSVFEQNCWAGQHSESSRCNSSSSSRVCGGGREYTMTLFTAVWEYGHYIMMKHVGMEVVVSTMTTTISLLSSLPPPPSMCSYHTMVLLVLTFSSLLSHTVAISLSLTNTTETNLTTTTTTTTTSTDNTYIQKRYGIDFVFGVS